MGAVSQQGSGLKVSPVCQGLPGAAPHMAAGRLLAHTCLFLSCKEQMAQRHFFRVNPELSH